MTKIIEIREDNYDNKVTYYIKLGRTEKTAKIYKDDYEELLELGVSASWSKGGVLGYVTAYCKGAPGNRVNIARVLMNAGAKETVRFIDGDRTNHLRENLVKMVDPKASRRARDFLTVKEAA